MNAPMPLERLQLESDVYLLGFALGDCVVEIDKTASKYLRAVHRTALELATLNRFGVEIGGFWLMQDQLTQLRKLVECYPPDEAPRVAQAVEAYIRAQGGTAFSLYGEICRTRP